MCRTGPHLRWECGAHSTGPGIEWCARLNLGLWIAAGGMNGVVANAAASDDQVQPAIMVMHQGRFPPVVIREIYDLICLAVMQ